MKKLLTILLILTFSRSALGQTPPLVTFPPGDDRIVPLRNGQVAPFDGQLFDTNTALRWGNWMQQYQLRMKVDVETQKQLDMAQINYLNQVLELERKQYATVTTDYQKKVSDLEKQLQTPPPFYRTQTFSFVMGAVVMTGVFALSVWALEARK